MKKSKPAALSHTALVTAMLLEFSSPAVADTIVVDGICTLHDAITSANDDAATGNCTAGSGDDVLELTLGSDIVLNTALPTITNNLTINGNSSTISRDAAAPEFRIIECDFSELTVNDVTLTGGISPNGNRGGAIHQFYGDLTINNSVIVGNEGGGIYHYSGAFEMNHTRVEDNTGKLNASFGSAGITLVGASGSINHSNISNNHNANQAKGGALFLTTAFLYNGIVTLNNSTVSGNSSESGAGAIHISNGSFGYMYYTSRVILSQVTVTMNSTNQDGGAIVVEDGELRLRQSLITGNQGSLVNEILNFNQSVSMNDHNLLGLNGSTGSVGVNLGSSDAVINESDLNRVLNLDLTATTGSTSYHILNPAGPAVDFILEMDCRSLVDQSGQVRPIDGDGDGTADCDVGSSEYSDVIFADGFD